VKKAYKKWVTIKYICIRADGETFLKLYKSYILPIVEYGNLIYAPNIAQTKRIEKIQKVCKFIAFKMPLKHLRYEQILEKIGLTSLENRRKVKILDLVQKIRLNFNCIPNEWHSRLTFTNNDRNGVYIRSNRIRIYKCEQTLFNYCRKVFNDLPKQLRNIEEYKTFMKGVKTILK
jgi:hypothetical protein